MLAGHRGRSSPAHNVAGIRSRSSVGAVATLPLLQHWRLCGDSALTAAPATLSDSGDSARTAALATLSDSGDSALTAALATLPHPPDRAGAGDRGCVCRRCSSAPASTSAPTCAASRCRSRRRSARLAAARPCPRGRRNPGAAPSSRSLRTHVSLQIPPSSARAVPRPPVGDVTLEKWQGFKCRG